jgi:hypothetical protein
MPSGQPSQPGEIYVQLVVNIARNKKVRKLSRFGAEARPARDLYVQMLCHAKENMTDGFVSVDEIGVLVYPDPPDIAARDVKHLIDVGLVEEAEDGYIITGWFDRNRSRAEIRGEAEASRDAGVRGNHKRWHVERDVFDPKCALCRGDDGSGPSGGDGQADRGGDRGGDCPPESGATSPPPDDPKVDQGQAALDLGHDLGQATAVTGDAAGQSDASGGRSGGRHDPESTKSKSETKSKSVKNTRPTESAISETDPHWMRFWASWPKKVKKKPARQKWYQAVVVRHVDPEVVLAGAERYVEVCRASGTETQFVAAPDAWLNQERWEDDYGPSDVNARPPADDIWNSSDDDPNARWNAS